MNIFKHTEQEFPKKKEDAGFHLHLLSMKGVKITVSQIKAIGHGHFSLSMVYSQQKYSDILNRASTHMESNV